MDIFSKSDYYPQPSSSVILYKEGSSTEARKHVLQCDLYALIVHLSSPLDAVSYSTFSDFFLIYRNFIEPIELYNLLILRFKWCITEIGKEEAMNSRLGQVVLVRTFVLLRHGILNHFMDDFINNVQLRINFIQFLNKDYTKHGKMIQDCIITLKKLWTISMKNTWDNIILHEPNVNTTTLNDKKAWLHYRLRDITQLNRESTKESRLSFTAQQRISNPDFRNQSVLSLFKDNITYKLDVKQKNNDKRTHSMLLFPNNNSNIVANGSNLNRNQIKQENVREIKKNFKKIGTTISKNQYNIPSAITDLEFPKDSQVNKILPATPAKNVEIVLNSSYFPQEDEENEEMDSVASIESHTINTNDIRNSKKHPRRKLSLNETIGSRKTLKRSSTLSSSLSIGPKGLLTKWKGNHAKYKNQNERIVENSLISTQKVTKPEMDKFVKYVISISSLHNDKNDQNGIDILDSSKFDILSARTIDEVEHLLLIENQLLEKMNQMRNVSKIVPSDHDDSINNTSSDSVSAELPKPSTTFSAMDNLDLYQTVNSIAQSVISLSNTLNTSNNLINESSTPILGRRQVKSSIVNFFAQTNNSSQFLSEDPILENVSPIYDDGPQRLIFHTSSNESNSRPDSVNANIISSSPVKLSFSPKKKRSHSPLKKTLDDVKEVNGEDENFRSLVDEVEGKVLDSVQTNTDNESPANSNNRKTVVVTNITNNNVSNTIISQNANLNLDLNINNEDNRSAVDEMETIGETNVLKLKSKQNIPRRPYSVNNLEKFSFENSNRFSSRIKSSPVKPLEYDDAHNDSIEDITDIYSHLDEPSTTNYADGDENENGTDNENNADINLDMVNKDNYSSGNDSDSVYEDTFEDIPLSETPMNTNSLSNPETLKTSIVNMSEKTTPLTVELTNSIDTSILQDNLEVSDNVLTNDNHVTVTAIRPASGRISIIRRGSFSAKSRRTTKAPSPLPINLETENIYFSEKDRILEENEHKLIDLEQNMRERNSSSPSVTTSVLFTSRHNSPKKKPTDKTQPVNNQNERVRLSIQPSIQSIASDGTFSSFSTFETTRNERVSLRTKFQKDFASHDSAFESNVSNPKYFFEPDSATVDDVSPMRDMEELKNKVLNLDDSTPIKNEEQHNETVNANTQSSDARKELNGKINENILKNIADITDDSVHVDPLKLAMMKLEGTYQKRSNKLNEVDKLGFVSVPEVNKLTKEIENLDISNIVSIPNTPMEKRRSLLIERRRRTIIGLPYTNNTFEETDSSINRPDKIFIEKPDDKLKQITNIQTLLQDYKIEDPNLAMNNNKNHIPFILSYDSVSIAEQLTLIEKELMCEIDWKDMLELKITYKGPDVTSWLQLLVQNETLSGIDLAVARFNLTVDWIISEIVLTDDVKLKRSTIQRYIHIAEHCRKFQNYNTLMQIILALSSIVVQKYIDAWRLIEPGDMVTWEELKNLPSLNNNYQKVRGLLNDVNPLTGCIPFLVVYLSDLSLNSEKRNWIEESKIINYNKFDTNVQIVKHFIQRVQWAKNYKIEVNHELLSKCVYLTTLKPQEIENLVYGIPVETK